MFHPIQFRGNALTLLSVWRTYFCSQNPDSFLEYFRVCATGPFCNSRFHNCYRITINNSTGRHHKILYLAVYRIYKIVSSEFLLRLYVQCIFPLKSHLKAASLLFGRSAKNKVKLVSVHPSWLAPPPIIGKFAVLPVCLDIVLSWPTPARVSNCTVTSLVVQNVAICECSQKALAVETKSISVLSYSLGLVFSLPLGFVSKTRCSRQNCC